MNGLLLLLLTTVTDLLTQFSFLDWLRLVSILLTPPPLLIVSGGMGALSWIVELACSFLLPLLR